LNFQRILVAQELRQLLLERRREIQGFLNRVYARQNFLFFFVAFFDLSSEGFHFELKFGRHGIGNHVPSQ
jgi:hypothetical protein